MQPHRRRSSATSQHSFHGGPQFEQDEASHAGAARLKPGAQLTLMRYLQDLPDAESVPPSDLQPRYHTGRVPNSKAGDGKPRLLLMGQRRCVPAVLRVVPFPLTDCAHVQERQVFHIKRSVSQAASQRDLVP
jgi:Ras-related GTP-binding protein C/D